MPRLSVDEWALGIAAAVSIRGECLRRQVGAVMLGRRHQVLSVGYNGAPAGEPSCLDGACPRASASNVVAGTGYAMAGCVVLHAEYNAIKWAPLDLVASGGCTLAITDEPCDLCWPKVRDSGVDRVIWPGGQWSRLID